MSMPTIDTRPARATGTAPPGGRLAVEYWTVVMGSQDSCTSCDQTLAEVGSAVDTVRPLAARLGITIELLPRTITTWPEAVDHGVVASPTLRAAGLEFRPSHPDESDARVWEWRGMAASSAPPEALLDFLVQAIAARSQQLGGYLARGGPAAYVRQFLRAAPTAQTPAPSSGRGGPAACA